MAVRVWVSRITSFRTKSGSTQMSDSSSSSSAGADERVSPEAVALKAQNQGNRKNPLLLLNPREEVDNRITKMMMRSQNLLQH
jgi:hypothetical protein